jgi:hypothetical protein
VVSDQTELQFEIYSIPRSKQLCPKIIGSEVFQFDEVSPYWDDIVLTCETKQDSGPWQVYQSELLRAVLHPDELIEKCFEGEPSLGSILMSGTIPIVDGVTRFADQYRLSLEVPTLNQRIEFSYGVDALQEPL